MKVWRQTRGKTLIGIVLAGMACGALGQKPEAGLPAAQPTSDVQASGSSLQSATVVPETAPRTRVTWTGGQLTITAENSSLNQILREISKQTGMKVTGGVNDERVYGSYGPGTPDAVLVGLLTGTGSNMLLKEDRAGGPKELVLSARAGGATPPNPGADAARDQAADEAVQPPQRNFPPRPRPDPFRPHADGSKPDSRFNVGQNANDGQTAPTVESAIPDQSSTPGQSSAPAAEQQSTGTAKTPQEIYDQLVKMQQQKTTQTPQ